MAVITKAELREYRSAVMNHWYLLILGAISLIILLVQTAGDATGWKLWPWWANVLLFAAALHWAQLLAWVDMKRERDALRKYNISLNTLKRLAEYRDQLVAMQNENVETDIQVGAFIERHKRLRAEIIEYLNGNISPAESNLFARVGLFAIYNIPNPPSLNDAHLKRRSWVIRDYFWLDQCVQDYGRRKLRPDEEKLDEDKKEIAVVSS